MPCQRIGGDRTIVDTMLHIISEKISLTFPFPGGSEREMYAEVYCIIDRARLLFLVEEDSPLNGEFRKRAIICRESPGLLSPAHPPNDS